MKVVYNWLKDFVGVTAPPAELASRLALSGTNIGSVETGVYGAVIDAEVSSNRPDCLGHYGIAREVGAIYTLPLKAVAPKPVNVLAHRADPNLTLAKLTDLGVRRISVGSALARVAWGAAQVSQGVREPGATVDVFQGGEP